MINRTEVARALAKAIAYKNCGKDEDAQRWAARLVNLLECHEILQPIWARMPKDIAETETYSRE